MFRPRSVDLRTQAGPVSARIADGFITRACGLLFCAPLSPGEALLILPCCRIHTFGMRHPIDAIFIDHSANVVAVVERLPARRIAGCRGARAVLEMTAGGAAAAGLYRGTRLAELEAVLR